MGGILTAIGEQLHSNYKTFFFSKQEKLSLGDRRPVSDPSPFLGLCSIPEGISLASPRASLPEVVIDFSSFCLRIQPLLNEWYPTASGSQSLLNVPLASSLH